MSFVETKSLLAKLLATENLTVEHRNVETASFDVKNRILTLPLFSELSADLSDLLVGHEVGHALETPVDLLIEAMERNIAKSVINVIEDARIERKIKNRYPGLRSAFVRGYRELVERDFFGIKGLDLNDMNFIDRVNMFYKAGAGVGINFVNDTEHALLNEIDRTETPADVITVSLKVMDYLKQEKEEKQKQKEEEEKNNPQEEQEQEESENTDEDFDNYGYDDSEDSSEEEEYNSNDDGSGEESEEEKESKKSEQKKSGGYGQNDDDTEIKAHTDEEFRKNENKLFETSNYEYYYGNIPDIDINKAVVDHKQIWKRYKEWSCDNYRNTLDIDESNMKDFIKIRTEANKVVSYLAKEFEMRKNAEQMKLSSVAKTGELNMSKVYSYKFSEDIFKKITVVPNGKSHGLVMFLDWSGSMSDHMTNTIKQLISLTLFCKKVNIPFEVYSFSSEYDFGYKPEKRKGDVAIENYFSIMNILSNRMSAKEYSYACSKLILSLSRYAAPHWFQMGGTPLNECIVAAMKIIPEFQKKNKLQIVNTVFLTDGEGHDLDLVWDEYAEGHIMSTRGTSRSYYNTKFVLRDPITKHQVQVENRGRGCTSAYIQLLKARTNCNVIGYYILSGREFGSVARSFYSSVADFDKLKSEFRKDKYKIVTSAGFDEYYLLRAENLNTDDGTSFEVKENSTTRGLVTAFSKYNTNKLSNRVILNRFIGLIA
jgi:hypothetical protein